MANLLFFALALGIAITGMIFRYTTKIQALAWSFAGLLMPVSCVIVSDVVAAEVVAGHRVDDADGAFVRRDAPGSGRQGIFADAFLVGRRA